MGNIFGCDNLALLGKTETAVCRAGDKISYFARTLTKRCKILEQLFALGGFAFLFCKTLLSELGKMLEIFLHESVERIIIAKTFCFCKKIVFGKGSGNFTNILARGNPKGSHKLSNIALGAFGVYVQHLFGVFVGALPVLILKEEEDSF